MLLRSIKFRGPCEKRCLAISGELTHHFLHLGPSAFSDGFRILTFASGILRLVLHKTADSIRLSSIQIMDSLSLPFTSPLFFPANLTRPSIVPTGYGVPTVARKMLICGRPLPSPSRMDQIGQHEWIKIVGIPIEEILENGPGQLSIQSISFPLLACVQITFPTCKYTGVSAKDPSLSLSLFSLPFPTVSSVPRLPTSPPSAAAICSRVTSYHGHRAHDILYQQHVGLTLDITQLIVATAP